MMGVRLSSAIKGEPRVHSCRPMQDLVIVDVLEDSTFRKFYGHGVNLVIMVECFMLGVKVNMGHIHG